MEFESVVEKFVFDQRRKYHEEIGAEFTGEPGEDVDFKLRALVTHDGALDHIHAKEADHLTEGFAKNHRLKKVHYY